MLSGTRLGLTQVHPSPPTLTHHLMEPVQPAMQSACVILGLLAVTSGREAMWLGNSSQMIHL